MKSKSAKELGFAVATDTPFLEPMRLGSTIGGGSDTLGYTLMGMAAAGYPGRLAHGCPYSLPVDFSIPRRRVEDDQLPAARGVRPVHHNGRCPARNQALPDSGPPS